ncbi:COX6A-domain-containing protein [Tothia fuscella]|uniref:Cytochrome c oxidase subunit n=1 Tax=Tothia fuscella TaxID=1048955 RepID=A0A9P4U1J9_9PEZI|nr:COX6A-domain-containing protein [Tothia fuscella]
MLAQRALLRSAQRLTPKAPVSRAGKRFYSSPTEENAFIRERAAVKHHAAESAELWRKLSIYVALPAVIIFSANAYTLWNEHWEHVAHSTPMEERPQYEYLNIRAKAYPWGDGDKTLFWNDKHNYRKKE